MDVWARELINLYPPQARCAWNLIERPLFDALTHDGDDVVAAWTALRERLERHKRSHQWRVKRMIPRLDRYLREGLHLQELPEAEPIATAPEPRGRAIPDAEATRRMLGL